MTYTHLSTDELIIIEAYFHQNSSVTKISRQMGRARQTVHNVVTFLKRRATALDYYKRYKQNKKRCGRKQTVLPADQHLYVEEKVAHGLDPRCDYWSEGYTINCSGRTLYRLFKRQQFDISTLPMYKESESSNGHKERRGRQTFKRNISEREEADYPAFNVEFGHLEGDTIVGVHHKSAYHYIRLNACQKPSSR